MAEDTRTVAMIHPPMPINAFVTIQRMLRVALGDSVVEDELLVEGVGEDPGAFRVFLTDDEHGLFNTGHFEIRWVDK